MSQFDREAKTGGGGYKWRGGEDERAAEAAEKVHEAIKNEAKKRTEWEEWMTEEVGYAAIGTIQEG